MVHPLAGLGSVAVLWLVSIGFHAYDHAFSLQDVNQAEFSYSAEHTDGGRETAEPNAGFADPLREIEVLRREGVINEKEYEHKRQEVLHSNWQ